MPVQSAEAFRQAFAVSRETTGRLEAYAELLRTWQRAINLVAPGTLDQVWDRHFADSAQLLAHAPPGALRWVDLGSGAGFPGLVIGILLMDRPGARVTLVESDARKAAFLAEVARKTGAAVDIVSSRIEHGATQGKVGAVDVITARALAPLPRLLELAAPLFGTRTVALFLKGRAWAEEIEEARLRWLFEVTTQPSLTDPAARVVAIRQLRSRAEDTVRDR